MYFALSQLNQEVSSLATKVIEISSVFHEPELLVSDTLGEILSILVIFVLQVPVSQFVSLK
jgi:hypothetical protein